MQNSTWEGALEYYAHSYEGRCWFAITLLLGGGSCDTIAERFFTKGFGGVDHPYPGRSNVLIDFRQMKHGERALHWERNACVYFENDFEAAVMRRKGEDDERIPLA